MRKSTRKIGVTKKLSYNHLMGFQKQKTYKDSEVKKQNATKRKKKERDSKTKNKKKVMKKKKN